MSRRLRQRGAGPDRELGIWRPICVVRTQCRRGVARGERGGRRIATGTRRERLEFPAMGSRSHGERLASRFTFAEVTPIATTPLGAALRPRCPPRTAMPRRSRATVASCWPRSTTAGSDHRGRASASARWLRMWPDPRRRARAVPSTTGTPLRAYRRPAARRRRPCSGPVCADPTTCAGF